MYKASIKFVKRKKPRKVYTYILLCLFAAERASESDSITNEDSSDNQISMNQNTTTAHDGATTIKTQDDKGKESDDELMDVDATD